MRLRPGTGPGEVAGYAVSLPGMVHHRDGRQVWYGGQTLDARLGLGALRGRWRAGRPGAPAAAAAFDGAETADIFRHAARAADDAARQLRARPAPGQAADIAWAAADVLYAAADATGSAELRRAADGFDRAARAPWGRIPPPSAAGSALRTAAYLMARPVPDRTRRKITRMTLSLALASLAGAVADLRQAQQRPLQAAAARHAAARLSTVTARPVPGPALGTTFGPAGPAAAAAGQTPPARPHRAAARARARRPAGGPSPGQARPP